nr:ribosomal large subunit pseudouridine synthase D-like [Nerophis lumbriciformis]
MKNEHRLTVATTESPRLDAWLAGEMQQLSRARIQTLIKEGHILLNGKKTKARAAVKEADEVHLTLPEPETREILPQDIPLSVLYEDEYLIVINKDPGLVVHPADGNPDGTLVNALLHHCDGQLAQLDSPDDHTRPGIVHRLDKDTSGCIVAAKTKDTHLHLVSQFAERQTSKHYLAIAQSAPADDEQTVFNNIGRHPVHRQKMAVVNPGSGKPAITDFRLLHTATDGTSLLLCTLHTGRTHQIRVHTQFLGHPLLGDPIYAKPARQPTSPTRLMLHAWQLGFTHPASGKWITHQAPIPPEFTPWAQPAAEQLATIQATDKSQP